MTGSTRATLRIEAAAGTPARRGSLASVLEGMRVGAATVDELAAFSGLDPDLVRLALDRLVALGRVSSDRASTSCPASGCGGCAVPTGSGCSSGGLTTLTVVTDRRA